MATSDASRIFDPSEHDYAVKATVYGNNLTQQTHETKEAFVKRIVRSYLRALAE